jgi:HipA-like protein
MAKAKIEQLWVWFDDPEFGPLQHIGILSRGDRGTIRFTFEQAWLKHGRAFPLNLELDLSAGEFFPGDSHFSVFLDSCPDRWGQVLIKRKDEHVLSLDLYHRKPDLEVVLSTARYYRLDADRAAKIVTSICMVVGTWKARARKLGLSARECSEAEHLFCRSV